MKQVSSSQVTTLLNTTVVGQPWQKSFQLGLGVDAITGQLRASAMKPFTVVPKPTQNPQFIYSLVQSESDMQSMISGSAEASYNLEGVTVSASTSFLDSLAVSELAVTLVAQVKVEESQFSLAPKYELAVQPDKQFRDKYGDYFVAGYRGGSSLNVVYQCRFSSAKQRSEFTASLAADVPQVFSASGSTSFEKTSKQFSANISIKISAIGVNSPIPSPPSSGWTPDTIVLVLLPWFNSSIAMEPLETYLEHYRLVDPAISGDVPISPNVFSQLGFLYNRFRLARAWFNTCPDFGRRLVEARYHKLESHIEAYQSSFPLDLPAIEQTMNDVNAVLDSLREINNRQVFYTQAIAAAKTEPAPGANHDADKGVLRWSYGFQRSNMPGIEINDVSDSVEADWKIGWREHVFAFRDSTKIIVGWDVTCNRTDGWGGDWHKVSQQIIGRASGDVYVKSDYDRGYNWSIVWHLVDANLYPVGPWSEAAIHAPEFSMTIVADVHAATAFWTAERMAQARPVDRSERLGDPSPEAERSVVGGGAGALQFRGTSPSSGQSPSTIGPITSMVANPQQRPNCTVGKLFFYMNGQPFTASAVVVHPMGIMTAAHCLKDNGQEASNIVFVPAYQSGNTPFRVWNIGKFAWPNSWEQTQNTAWDLGFCEVPKQNGQCIGDVVGWVGLAWGGVAAGWNDMGYPTQATPVYPFNGQIPWQCLGSRVDVPSPSIIFKRDNLTAGASGGPWFMGDAADMVNGVQSRSDLVSQLSCSPEFADWVGDFYSFFFRN